MAHKKTIRVTVGITPEILKLVEKLVKHDSAVTQSEVVRRALVIGLKQEIEAARA
jgi:hypothetical protein